MKKEQIMVVDAELLKSKFGVKANGVILTDEAEFKRFVIDNHRYEWRDLVETDPSLRQIISYCMIVHGDSVFVTKRTKKQTEARLHNLYSIGIGGHVSLCDGSDEDIIEAGLQRELHEEVFLNSDYTLKFDGIINDDSTPVNSVHTALCYTVTVDKPDCAVRETEKMVGEWVKISELSSYVEGMEGWSVYYLSAKGMI